MQPVTDVMRPNTTTRAAVMWPWLARVFGDDLGVEGATDRAFEEYVRKHTVAGAFADLQDAIARFFGAFVDAWRWWYFAILLAAYVAIVVSLSLIGVLR